MRKTAKAFSVCALALAVLLGMAASSGAAEKTGPTGKTQSQCDADMRTCLKGVVDAYNTCWDNIQNKGGICDQGFDASFDACSEEMDNCYGTSSKAKILGKLGKLIISQPQILEGLDALSVKLNNLAAQVGAALPADLVALPDPFSQGFCRLSPDLTKLQVYVNNQGTAGAPASTTHVDFANNPGVDMPTPPLGAGGTAVIEFAIPASCYDASNNCHFSIVVDSTNTVIESNGEANNTVAGVCGPSIQ
jgi:hypothetical protein